jgi:hypothetical protein
LAKRLKRPALLPPKPARPTRRSGGALAFSIVLHVVIGAGILELLLMPHPHANWLTKTHQAAPPVERIGFLALPKTGTEVNPGKNGGNGRAISKQSKPASPLVAPSSIPSSLPAVPPKPADSASGGGTGPVVGTGGATEGVRPQFNDPRVWVGPAPVVTAPKTTSQQLDSSLAATVKVHNDSMMVIYGGKQPGDWTFHGNNGQKWGIDQQYIHLGPVSLPDAVLAMLPINHVGENAVLGQRERQLNAMHDDIQEGAHRQMNEDDFHRAVKETRERKQREHDELLKLQEQAKPKPTTPTTPTIANDGGTYSAPRPQPDVQ